MNCSPKDSKFNFTAKIRLTPTDSVIVKKTPKKKKVKQFHTVENSPGHKKTKTKQFAVSAVDCVQ